MSPPMFAALAAAATLMALAGAASPAEGSGPQGLDGRCSAGDAGVMLMQVKRKHSLAPAASRLSVGSGQPTCAGQIRWATHPGKCLDVAQGSAANGANVQLWDCDADGAGMAMLDHSAGPHGAGYGGLGVCAGDCDSDADCAAGLYCHQRNDGQPGPAGCLGEPLQAYDYCTLGVAPEAGSGDRQQAFTLPSSGVGLIRWTANPHKCLDVSGGGNWNGNTIQLWDCYEEHPNMMFEVTEGGSIRWAGTDKCLDVSAGGLQPGTDIQIWDCYDLHPNQRFEAGSCAGSAPATPAAPAPAPTTTSSTTAAPQCHTAVEPEECFGAVKWAMTEGISQHPYWYPGLSSASCFEDFQRLLHGANHGGCGEPCDGCQTQPTAAPPTPSPPTPQGPQGPYQGSGQWVGSGWCSAEVPVPAWSLLSSCGSDVEVKVLTYNLFWWNLFGVRGGNGGSAGRLIADNGLFDIMGFQECDDVWRVLGDAGIASSYSVLPGSHALAVAYRTAAWEELSSGVEDVAEDRPEQYYGRRAAQWGRLRHRASGKVVFFLNHHGPLPVNTGGVCGGEATAYNILRTARENSQDDDVKIVLGDLNNDAGSVMQRTLQGRMTRVSDDWVDAIFTSCEGSLVSQRNLGNGGSDHNALEAVFRI